MQKLINIFLLLPLLFVLPSCMEAPEGMLSKGSEAPFVRTKRLSDVDGDMSRLTSYRYPDKRMYQYSIDEALKFGKPVVVEFATPGHCTVCDKQLQMLKAMIDKYGSDVLFLHMDQYKNPEAFTAFKVKGDPWTFVINEKREVVFTRAGRMLYGEMDNVLGNVVGAMEKG